MTVKWTKRSWAAVCSSDSVYPGVDYDDTRYQVAQLKAYALVFVIFCQLYYVHTVYFLQLRLKIPFSRGGSWPRGDTLKPCVSKLT